MRQLLGQSKEKEIGGLKESISNGDREKQTDLNDISDIDLTGSSLRGGF